MRSGYGTCMKQISGINPGVESTAYCMLTFDDTFIVDSTQQQQQPERKFRPQHTPPVVIETIARKSLLMQPQPCGV